MGTALSRPSLLSFLVVFFSFSFVSVRISFDFEETNCGGDGESGKRGFVCWVPGDRVVREEKFWICEDFGRVRKNARSIEENAVGIWRGSRLRGSVE